MKFENFTKLQSRYWIHTPLLDPDLLHKDFSRKIMSIEGRDFGVDEDTYIATTQAKIIINGLALKIYEFLRDSISLIETSQYIATISLLRLCLEHIAMLCLFHDRLLDNIEKKDRLALRVLLTSFCMGERIFFVEATDKESGKRIFSTRSEHLNSALRHFDRNYTGHGIQTAYDILSNHTHVSPTSSVRMLYRQKVWNKSEPNVDWRRVRLSTKSNSHQKTASVGMEMLLGFFKVAEKEVLEKQETLWKLLEKVGKQIELNSSVSSKEDQIVQEMMSRHDSFVQDFLKKLEKYGNPEQK